MIEFESSNGCLKVQVGNSSTCYKKLLTVVTLYENVIFGSGYLLWKIFNPDFDADLESTQVVMTDDPV